MTARAPNWAEQMASDIFSEGPTYPAPSDGWVCFHCGERFKSWGAARDHFGETPRAFTGCVLKGEERGLLMALRKAEAGLNAAGRDAGRGRELWKAVAEAKLPCAVQLAPATVMVKGVSFRTLLIGLKARGMAVASALLARLAEDGDGV